MAELRLIAPPLLSRYAIDRADELRADAAALDAGWAAAKVLALHRGGQFAVTADGALTLVAGAQLSPTRPVNAVLLGRVDGELIFAVDAPHPDGNDRPTDAADLRTAGAALSATDAALVTLAMGMLNWHRSARFAPRTGEQTTPQRGGWTRVTADGREEFPRTDPAMIALVHDGADHVLLGRQQQWPQRRFSLFAGFVEPGESLEQCVAREIYEEAGIAVSDITYVASQPWPFPRSLMIGFTATADPAALLDFRDGEIAEAHWFSRDQVSAAIAAGDWGSDDADAPLLVPNSISIARGIIEAWAAGTSAG